MGEGLGSRLIGLRAYKAGGRVGDRFGEFSCCPPSLLNLRHPAITVVCSSSVGLVLIYWIPIPGVASRGLAGGTWGVVSA